MPEPLLRKTIPGRPGMEMTIERVGSLWFVAALVDGHMVAQTISDDQQEAAEIWGRSVVLLSLGTPIEDVPLEPAGARRVRPTAEIVPVPLHSTEYFRARPWDGDHDPDGGVFT